MAPGAPLPANASGIQAAGTPCNMIPTSLLNTTMVNYAKTLFPAPINTGNPDFNGRDTTPSIIRQDQISIRGDQQIGANDRIFARYTAAWQPDSVSGGYPRLHRRYSKQQLQRRRQLDAHFRSEFGVGVDVRARFRAVQFGAELHQRSGGLFADLGFRSRLLYPSYFWRR